jgi:hypothetical protein
MQPLIILSLICTPLICSFLLAPICSLWSGLTRQILIFLPSKASILILIRIDFNAWSWAGSAWKQCQSEHWMKGSTKYNTLDCRNLVWSGDHNSSGQRWADQVGWPFRESASRHFEIGNSRRDYAHAEPGSRTPGLRQVMLTGTYKHVVNTHSFNANS